MKIIVYCNEDWEICKKIKKWIEMFELDVEYKEIEKLEKEEERRIKEIIYEKKQKESGDVKGILFPIVFIEEENRLGNKEKKECRVIWYFGDNEIVICDCGFKIEILYYKKVFEKMNEILEKLKGGD